MSNQSSLSRFYLPARPTCRAPAARPLPTKVSANLFISDAQVHSYRIAAGVVLSCVVAGTGAAQYLFRCLSVSDTGKTYDHGVDDYDDLLTTRRLTNALATTTTTTTKRQKKRAL